MIRPILPWDSFGKKFSVADVVDRLAPKKDGQSYEQQDKRPRLQTVFASTQAEAVHAPNTANITTGFASQQR